MPHGVVRNEKGDFDVIDGKGDVMSTHPTEQQAWYWYDNWYKSDDW